ncbi:MAG: 4Fe-4S binding protein [Firmicutes bacterium]|mgnify:CR=1 FL=1|jgi:polyferredoxin|nr:4Fe-4S binding protein [Bacillota bacterium]
MNFRRKIAQIIAFFVANPFPGNFYRGRIYQGQLKGACVPVLNCYSCPAAAGSCPLGALQGMVAAPHHKFPMYIFGFLLAAGGLAGRWFCGWLCPFGLIQELIGKIGRRKLHVPYPLTLFKYLLLILLLLLPILWVDSDGFGAPYFCKYICPEGTLAAGIPLLLAAPELWNMVGTIFYLKAGMLVFILGASTVIDRPFCRTMCPLGAFYGLFNRLALFRIHHHTEKCISCDRCRRVCPMELDLPGQLNSTECIRCLSCMQICPTGAITFGAAPQSNKTMLKGRNNDVEKQMDHSAGVHHDPGNV